MGEFVRLGSEGELTTDHVRLVDGGLLVDGPWLASQVHVNATYLHDQLGDFAADQAYTMDDDRVVVDANDVTFTPFVPGQDAVFTHGSDASVRFMDRPMWVGVWDGGPRRIVLDLDDGDTTGQPVRLAKAWLAQYHIYEPRAIHEDGTVLAVEETADGQAFLLDVPHFSTIAVDDPPIAEFSYTPASPSTADTVEFRDESTDDVGLDAWTWDFGDGSTSSLRNPTHSYADDGTYTVKLTVTDTLGAKDSKSKSVTVSNVKPAAKWTYSPSSPDELASITFTDRSTDSDGVVSVWKWTFGDGTSSPAQNPSHTYADGGSYTVKLKVTDDDGAVRAKSKTITVGHLEPTADYTYDPASPDESGAVQMDDLSTHPNEDDALTAWSWDLGDGNTSTAQDPAHDYADGGDYTVKLTVTDDDEQTGTITQTVTVDHVPPVADFSYMPTTPDVWDTIQFTDASTHPNALVDSITSWSWEFGDGNTSPLQGPSHTYATNGTYTVKLTVTDDDGIPNTIQKTVTIASVPLVKVREGGIVQEHGDSKRWDPDNLLLEIDISTSSQDIDVLVEQAWVDEHIPHPALNERGWTRENITGTWFYVVSVGGEETPINLTFEEFDVPNANLFSQGSMEFLRATGPILMSVTTSPGELNVSLPGLQQGYYLTVNVTWLMDLGVLNVYMTSSEGRILSWGLSDDGRLQAPIPPNATYIVIRESDDPPAPNLFQFLGNFSPGDACRRVIGESQKIDEWSAGQSWAGLFVSATAFCFEWDLHEPYASFFNVEIDLTDEDNAVECGSGEETHEDYRSQSGVRVCQWEDAIPLGTINYRIVATSWYRETETDWNMVGTGVACIGGGTVLVVTAYKTAGTITAHPAWQLGADLVVSSCQEFVDGGGEIYYESVKIGDTVLWGTGTKNVGEEVVGVNEISLYDPGDYRADSWSTLDLEYRVPRRDYFDGKQVMEWKLKDISGAHLSYDADISKPDNVVYDQNMMSVRWFDGGATAQAKVTSFESANNYRETVAIEWAGGDDALDWEAPEQHCVYVAKIIGKVDGVAEALGLGPTGLGNLCNGIAASAVDNSSEPWLEFSLANYTLAADDILSSNGTVSVDEIIAEDGNVTRAVAKKLVSNEAFIDNITHVEVPLDHPDVAGCKHVYDEDYFSTMTAVVAGTTIAGGLDANDSDTLTVLICFDPLLGILGLKSKTNDPA